MIALLNAPILTTYGTFEYQPIAVDIARELIHQGFDSYIGHESTCQILSQILRTKVPLNRAQYIQQSGDQAIVFRLNRRLAEGEVLHTLEEVEAVGYELALITRTS